MSGGSPAPAGVVSGSGAGGRRRYRVTSKRAQARPRTASGSAGPRIYTRTGDRGETGLIGGRRVPKDHPRVEAYGAGDELNAHPGLVRGQTEDVDLAALLDCLEPRLFGLGAEPATPA